MKIKKYLSEPLLYLLPLLAIAGLWIIPAKSNISDVVLITDGISSSEYFPISTNKVKENSDFSISFNVDVGDNKNMIYRFYPDDCILSIEINGKAFPQEKIIKSCFPNGTVLDFSEYTQKGLNRIEFQMKNSSGPGGLRIEIPHHAGFRHILFFALLLLISALILRKFKLSNETIFACILSFPFVIYAFVELCIRINYEFSGAYQVWDAPIYYAVGRGIVNGIAPWSGLWDIKPPGIFLVSAISFKFFDSPVLTYCFQSFVLILTAAIPVVAYFLLSSYRSALKLALSLLAGLLLALYSAERAGEFQVESFGAAFACVAVFAMAMPDFEKRKILWISLTAIGLLGACGFKEPFLFPLFGVSLIFSKDIKDWLWRFALPLAVAILLGFVFLLICSWLGDFLYYLEFMSSAYISRHGSSFARATQFHRIYEDLNSFSRGFTISLLILLFLPLFKYFKNIRTSEETLFIKVVFFGLAFFLSSYSVGVGGDFFEHHFVFALPFYMALFLLLIKNWNRENLSVAKLGLLCLILLAIGTIDLPYRFERNQSQYKGINHFHKPFSKRTEYINNRVKEIKEAANYLDSKMDELGIDRYVFIGNHDPGTEIYGWTRHSPMGPYFFQPSQWFEQPEWFGAVGDSLVANIEKADAVVTGTIVNELKPQTDSINQILDEQFIKEQVNKFPIYIRKSKIRGDSQ